LANLTKIRREKTKINKSRSEKGEINTKEIQGIIESLGTTSKTYTQINWKI
jgi:hypothetical protein